MSTTQWSQPVHDCDPVVVTGVISAADAASTLTNGNLGGQILYTGTPTVNSAVQTMFTGQGTVRLQCLSSAWVGVLSLEQTMDGGTTWWTANCTYMGSGATTNTNSLTNALNVAVLVAASGTNGFRAHCTSYVSGNIAITIQAGAK